MVKHEESVTGVIEQVCEEMCTQYCKHWLLYKPEEHEGVELWESEICDQCPLNKLR